MAKHKGKDASELGGYVVFGVIVGFFLLIFYFIKLIVEEVQSIIKNNKKKERQKLREEKVVSMQEQHTEKTLEDEKSDDLNLLIQEAEEIYDEAGGSRAGPAPETAGNQKYIQQRQAK